MAIQNKKSTNASEQKVRQRSTRPGSLQISESNSEGYKPNNDGMI